MTGAFGYTVAIVVAALALRRLPVELSRWRTSGGAAGCSPIGPAGRRGSRHAGRSPSHDRPGERRVQVVRPVACGAGCGAPCDDAAVASTGESRAVTVWGAAVGAGFLGGLLLAATPGAAIGAGAGLLGPPAALWAARHRRARLVVEALPDFLERVARSLRAGVSTVAALEEVLPATGPLGTDLRRVLVDVRVGQPADSGARPLVFPLAPFRR